MKFLRCTFLLTSNSDKLHLTCNSCSFNICEPFTLIHLATLKLFTSAQFLVIETYLICLVSRETVNVKKLQTQVGCGSI